MIEDLMNSINLLSLATHIFNPPRHYKTDFILFSICQKPPDAYFRGDIYNVAPKSDTIKGDLLTSRALRFS